MAGKNKKKTCGILIIGNEILSGRTKDQNLSYLAHWLNKNLGITVEEARIIPDIESKIIKTVLELSKKHNYVITTGGIGPTHDDITAKSVSKAFKRKYSFNKEAFSILKNYYGKDFNNPRKKMAKMPEGSRLVLNPSSAAPGFKVNNVICLPGVPLILQSMMNSLRKHLEPGSRIQSITISCETVESEIAKHLEKIQKRCKKFVEIGSYPFFRLGKIGVSIVIRSSKKKYLHSCHKDIIKMLKIKSIKVYKDI